MSKPMRLNSALVTAAEREGAVHRRTPPKQIEFWAELGRSVAHIMDYADAIAVMEGIKKIVIEPQTSVPVDPDDVFNSLEKSRKSGELSKRVTSSAVYYEASLSYPGLLDRVDSATGERHTGQFRNGEFKVQG